VPRLTRTLSTSAADAEGLWSPRRDVVVEVADGPDRFAAERGPFAGYERLLERTGDEVTEVTRYRLAPTVFRVPFGLLYRRALRAPRRASSPWWAPADVPDARSATTLFSLCAIAIVSGYLGTLLTQTLTFTADEYHVSDTAQGALLAAVRVGVLGSLALTALADRKGRRRVLLGVVSIACVASALGALSPWLAGAIASQFVVRTLVSASTVLLTVAVAEEMPAGARAYGVSLLGLCGALGVGTCLVALPLADLGTHAWRILYVLPLLGLPVVRAVGRHLPETRRFTVTHPEVRMAGHGGRLWLLAGSAFLLNLFKDPASQLLNEFLRDERGYSAAGITSFSIVTNLPGFFGVVIGGYVADKFGRRGIGAVAVLSGAGFTVVQMFSSGGAMWVWSLVASVIGAAAIPALGVYGPELFPTSLRGRANGVIAVVGVLGTIVGLVSAGYLSDRWDGLAPALALLSIGPLVMAGLVVLLYPETAQRELEALNPEDPTPNGGPAPTR
jgi:putative MFS transporter